MKTIRLKALKGGDPFELSAKTVVLRVPYDFNVAEGPCLDEGLGIFRSPDDSGGKILRTSPTSVGECRAGERVLVQLDPPRVSAAGWWLCEVDLVEQIDAVTS